MSRRGFESLFYTDCRPGQGLRGGAGFQFQAVSPGASDEMMHLVQRSALYEVPVGWTRTDRPVADYPPSLAHVCDGVYATARGVYLGAEAGGVRAGNQFTHAVSTVDPSGYGPVRPAQFWNAPWWSERPAAGTECAPVPADPEPGPFGVETVRDWLLGRQDGQRWLVALHSALDRGVDRVVLVGADPAEIVRWIAASTLLLPQERALRVGFRVFGSDPRYGRHEVLGLHPDWAGNLAEPEGAGFAVFNLESGRRSSVEPTEAAQDWVPRFLRDDPYDVIDAVELAHQFARDQDRDRPNSTDRLASCVLTLGEPVRERAHAVDLSRWLASVPWSRAAETTEPIIDGVLDAGADATVLRELVRNVHSAPEELVGRLRCDLLRAEIDAIVRSGPEAEGARLPERAWSPEEHGRASTLVESAVMGLPPDRVGSLLRLAARFDVAPRLDRCGSAVPAFVSWWADTPEADRDPASWACSTQLIDLLRDELQHRLRGHQSDRTREAVRQRWWPLLLPTMTDPLMQLDRLVAGAAVAHGGRPRAEALARMRVLLREADRAEVVDAVWSALFGSSEPTVREVGEFLAQVSPPYVSTSLSRRISEVLDGTEPTVQHLELARLWRDHLRTDSLVALGEQDEVLQRWLDSFRTTSGAKSSWDLRTVTGPVLDARAPEVVDALLRVRLPMALKVAARNGEPLQGMLVRELTTIWSDPRGDERADKAVGLAFLVSLSPELPDDVRDRFDGALRLWAQQCTTSDHRRIGKLLRTTVNRDRAADWQTWLSERGGKAAVRRAFGSRRKRGG